MRTLPAPKNDARHRKSRGPTSPPSSTPLRSTAELRPSEPRDRPPWLLEALAQPERRGASLPEPEGLSRASCGGPSVRVARSAIAAAADGVDRETWRLFLHQHDVPAAIVAEAEECARTSGIWPWSPGDSRSRTSRQSPGKEQE